MQVPVFTLSGLNESQNIDRIPMMKRTYSIVAFENEQTVQMLLLKFTDPKFQSLSNFLNSEVHNFYLDVREALENVISGSMEEYAFDGNLLGIEVGKEITEVYF